MSVIEELKGWLEEDMQYHKRKWSGMRADYAILQRDAFILAYKKVLNKIAELEQRHEHY